MGSSLKGDPLVIRMAYSFQTQKATLIWVVVKIRVPFWGTLNNRCRIILGTQQGTLILTTTHIEKYPYRLYFDFNGAQVYEL